MNNRKALYYLFYDVAHLSFIKSISQEKALVQGITINITEISELINKIVTPTLQLNKSLICLALHHMFLLNFKFPTTFENYYYMT